MRIAGTGAVACALAPRGSASSPARAAARASDGPNGNGKGIKGRATAGLQNSCRFAGMQTGYCMEFFLPQTISRSGRNGIQAGRQAQASAGSSAQAKRRHDGRELMGWSCGPIPVLRRLPERPGCRQHGYEYGYGYRDGEADECNATHDGTPSHESC